MTKKQTRARMHWYTIDLHIHTPASSDYQEAGVNYLDLLRQAEQRGLEIIAFTDHNTVAGYRRMQEEIEQLELLQKLERLLPEERSRLTEYHRLLGKILVLPGFEFTATLGFHILGIFPPNKPVREIEHLLLDLNIPGDRLDDGSALVGATADVISAYRVINQAGGLVIAAHANSSNGVAMRGYGFGGQTKIAYTQDPDLHALEVTDLEHKGRRTTAAFFNGTKPEYPRRMHCIQGSDAHRLSTDPKQKKNLGIGDRSTDVLLPEVSFMALYDLFQSNDFARTRPHRKKEEPIYDFILNAREEGSNIIQDFHEGMTVRGGRLYALIADICAFANTNGGTLYIGLSADPKKKVLGVPNPDQAIALLEKEISARISPPLQCSLDVYDVRGAKVIRILVPHGDDPPYVVDDYKIYVRTEAETNLAVRDEIVSMVTRGKLVQDLTLPLSSPSDLRSEKEWVVTADDRAPDAAPLTGVEIVSADERKGTEYYKVRDLRNGNVVNNVTEKSARKLWHYAITRYAKIPQDLQGVNVQWHRDLGLLRKYKQGKKARYDLVQRTPGGTRFYFGVTEDGIHGYWKELVGSEDD